MTLDKHSRTESSYSRRRAIRNALLAPVLVVGLLGFGAVAQAQSNAAADLEALIKAAKAEGNLLFYASPTDNINKRIGDAFKAKYGISYSHIRAGSSQLEIRYAAEAEAGNIAADLIINAGEAASFAEDGIKKGWIEAVSTAGLPVVTSGTFPKRFITGPTAVVQILPWLVAYNTTNVKGADVPKDWTDLLNPKWKTQILLSNPKVSDAYIHFWSLLHDKYGDAFFEKIRPNLRPAATGVQAAQGLGAGEASFLIPAVSPQVMEPMKKGAPVNMVILPYTTGVEQHIVLTARAKAKHPNAARLFTNFIMTEEGNKLMNSDPGGFSMYETAKLPKDYHSPRPGAKTRRESTAKLLGF